MKPQTHRYKEIAREQMADVSAGGLLDLFPAALSARRRASYDGFADPAEANAQSAAIREESLAHLPELLVQFEQNAIKAGAKVYWAADSCDANAYIARLAKARGVAYVTKGKSMVTEEMGLNEELEAVGVQAYESDLGEFITQLLHRPPFHIVGPAINIAPQTICDIFLEKGIMREPTLDPVQLGYAARHYLRDKFHHLEMGITGVNMAVAETGTVINVENEGNIRLSKSSSDIQVSVMTLEKVVPTMADAVFMLRNLCRSATGQLLSAYVSMDTGPRKTDEIDGPSELHIIILDNGRSNVYADPEYRDALRCIRCGACLNSCPIYRKVGGYPYGWAYSGPMGQMLTPLLLGLDRTRDLYYACTLCRNCCDVCPAGVNHTRLLRRHRRKNREKDKLFRGGGVTCQEEAGFRLFATAAATPALWRALAGAARIVVNRKSRGNVVRQILGKSEGWLASRDLPKVGRPTFNEWYRKEKSSLVEGKRRSR
jgi:L-lactate dehydrogenase complex protein LldF